MKVTVAKKETIKVPGRASMCCGACCAALGTN